MKLQKAQNKKTEPTVPLSHVKPGECVRFAHDTLEEAFKADLFFMRIEAPEVKVDRVRLVNLTDGKQLERDCDHRVIVHKGALHLEC